VAKWRCGKSGSKRKNGQETTQEWPGSNARMARKQLKNGREATQEWPGNNVRMARKQWKNEAEAMEEFIEKMKVRKLFGQVRKKS
jgi:hypothetical protein